MAAFLNPIGSIVGKVLDRVLPDKAANDAAKAHLAELALSGELAQITGQLDIDKAEAASASVFVAGWGPFIGWICGVALAVDFIVRPFVMWACNALHRPADFPTLDMTELMPLVMTMLGMGALHVYQQTKSGDGK